VCTTHLQSSASDRVTIRMSGGTMLHEEELDASPTRCAQGTDNRTLAVRTRVTFVSSSTADEEPTGFAG